MDKKSSTTKLRGTEMLNHHFRYRTHTPVDEWHTDSFNEQAKLIFNTNQPKCGGRGMAIKQLSESITTFNTSLKNPNLSYSNSSIEKHFKNLRDENLKKLKVENEKLWGKMLITHKKN